MTRRQQKKTQQTRKKKEKKARGLSKTTTAPDQTECLIVCSEIATSPGGEHLDVFRVPGVAGERSFLPHNSRPVAQSSSLSTTARRRSKMCLLATFPTASRPPRRPPAK